MSSADDEIVVAITAQTAQLNEGIAQASATLEGMQAKVAADSAAFNAATQLKIEAIARLNAAFSGSVASTEGMAEAEGALDQAMQVGAITSQEYSARVAQLAAAETAAAEAAAAATAATEAQNAAMGVTGGVARELGVMIGEVMRGNYARLEGSTFTLANRTGLLSSAFQFLTSPAGLVIDALAAIGVAALEAMDDINNLQAAVISTGGASGNSVNQLREMEQALEQNGATARQARQAVTDVAQSGRLLGSSFQDAASAAVSMSELTGQSIEQCVKEISRLADDPVKVLKELNERFHFLTPEEAEQVKHLQDIGDTSGATAKAVSLLNGALLQYNQQLSQSGAGAQSFKERTEAAFSSAWEGVKSIFQPRTLQSQLDTINDMLTQYGERYKGSLTNGLSGKLNFNPNVQGLNKDDAQTINRLLEERSQLQAKITADQERGAQAARKEESDQQGVDQALGGGNETKNLEEQLHLQEAAQQVSYDKRGQFEADYWQKVFETSQAGSAQQAEAWEHMQSAQREIDNQELEEWRRTQTAKTEAARKAVQDVINTFGLERSEAQAASAQRIAVDSQLMDRLAQMEGTNSQHFREALNQRLADTKAFVDAAREENKKLADAAAAAYQEGAREDMKNVQAAFDHLKSIDAQKVTLGEMTAQQQLAAERNLAEQQYQIDLSILEKWRETYAERPNVVKEINKQIEALQTEHTKRMDQLNQQDTKDAVSTWDKRLAPITRGFNQSITGMIQGTQTLKQGMDRMFQSILLSEIQTDAERLQHWVATEIAKVGATAAGAETTKTIQATASAESKALDAANARGEVMNAAAAAGAKAYQAIVGIPIVGPILAPIAAGVAFAGVEAFGGNISSAAGGWDRVPYDDAPALLHRNEMVLPANLADRVRGMTDGNGGGRGDTHNWNIHAADSKSIAQLLHSDPHGLSRAAKRAIQFTKNRR
jgi:phage-related minor tail protein